MYDLDIIEFVCLPLEKKWKELRNYWINYRSKCCLMKAFFCSISFLYLAATTCSKYNLSSSFKSNKSTF